MNPIELFNYEKKETIRKMAEDEEFKKLSLDWFVRAVEHKFNYDYTWLGRPIIQLPHDIVLAQELIWSVKPDLIIETGIAHGGSIIFSASMLQLIHGDDDSRVVGIDIDIRKHNREEIEKHPMMKKIILLEGSSIDMKIVDQVREIAKNKKIIMLFLDSNHTHSHVLDELNLYSDLVSKDSYIVVWDTCIENLPECLYSDRPWTKSDNPKTAVDEFLKNNENFIVDEDICKKAIITCAERGFLKRIK